MKRRNKQLLVENEYVKELLAVLKENPSPSGKDFAEMVAHVGELESRLAEAVEELKTMRQELQQVQKSTFGFQRARHFCPGWSFPVFPCQTHAGRDQESD